MEFLKYHLKINWMLQIHFFFSLQSCFKIWSFTFLGSRWLLRMSYVIMSRKLRLFSKLDTHAYRLGHQLESSTSLTKIGLYH